MKNYICFLLPLISSVILAQRPIVRLEIEPKVIVIGQPITITVKSNIEGEIKIDFPSAFASGYSMMNGMEQEFDSNTGKVISMFYFSQNGTLNKEGSYTFGPASIRSGNKNYKSNTVNVTVKKETVYNSNGEISRNQLKQSAFGIIEKNKSVVYEGEALVINSKIYSRFYATHLEDYQSYRIEGALDKHEIPSSNHLIAKSEKLNNKNYFTIQYDRNIIFPSSPGTLQINPFKLILKKDFEGLPIVSTGTSVKVIPLPDGQPSSFIGMVGNLSMEETISKKEVKKGDVISYILKLSGTGNLQNISTPKIKLPKGIVSYGDPKITEHLEFGSKGAEGSVDFNFLLQIIDDGKYTIECQDVCYFDLAKEKYITLHTKKQELNGHLADNKGQSSAGATRVLKNQLLKNKKEEIRNVEQNKQLFSSPLLWLSIGGIVCVAAALGWITRPKISSKSTAAAVIPINKVVDSIEYSWGEIDEAIKKMEAENMGDALPNSVYKIEAVLYQICSIYAGIDYKTSNKTVLFSAMIDKNINEEILSKIKNTFHGCETARFGMDVDNHTTQELLNELKIISSTLRASKL